MRYSEILSSAISKSGLKLDYIAAQVGRLIGNVPTKHYLSRLQNGKTPPAGDRLNEALAQVLDIDVLEFKAAAYKEKIPADILEKLLDGCTG